MKGCMEAYSPEEELVRLLAKKADDDHDGGVLYRRSDRRNDRECGRRVGCAE